MTVRARTAAGLGEPVSIVFFAVQQGNIKKFYKGHNVLIVPFQEKLLNDVINSMQALCAAISFP